MSQTTDTNLTSAEEDEIAAAADHIKRAHHAFDEKVSRFDKELVKLSAKIKEDNQRMLAFSQQLEQEMRDLALRMERRRVYDQFMMVFAHSLGQNNGDNNRARGRR